MVSIKITKKYHYFLVEVIENNSKTEHKIKLDEKYYKNLTNGKVSKEYLIKKSFEFLLEREPKESILSSFNISLINHYFPNYEQEIKKML